MRYLVGLLVFMLPLFAKAQTKKQVPANTALYKQLFSLDSSLFAAFNDCNAEQFAAYLDGDLEFYDDRNGLNSSRDKEIESFKNRCGQPSFHLRRALVKESMQVYPLNQYGAVQMGEHRFYETINGQKEVLTGTARFIHIWQNKDGKWTITRIISYDHKAIKK
jgi:hypothetical protein